MIERSLLALAILSVAGTGICLAQNLSVQRFDNNQFHRTP